MAVYTYTTESLKQALEYGMLYCPKLHVVMAKGVERVLDADSLTIGPTPQVDGIVDGEHARFERLTRTLEEKALHFFKPDRLVMPDMLNRYQLAYAYLLQTAKETKAPGEYFHQLHDLNIFIEEGEPHLKKDKNQHYVFELALPDDLVHYWNDTIRFVYKEIPLSHIRAVHTRNIEVAKEQLRQLSIPLPLKLLK